MKKLLAKFFAILLSILCVMGMGIPISAAGQDTYFSFNENDVKMHIGESYQIQYQISSNYVITGTKVLFGDYNINYNESTKTVIAKQYGSATIQFDISRRNGLEQYIQYFNLTIAEDATGFYWNVKPVIKTINTSSPDYSLDFWIDSRKYTIEPENKPVFEDGLKFIVKDPNGVVTQDANESALLHANKSGAFTVTGSIDNQFSDTTQFKVLMGNYAEDIFQDEIDKNIRIGESFDIKQDIKQYLYPENGNFSDEKFTCRNVYFSEEIELKDGIVTGKSFGSGMIEVDLANGDTIYYRISVGFNDISMETPHYEDVQWLAIRGISTGYPDGSFRPFANVARCDMAAFIRRLAKDNNWLDASYWKPSKADWTVFEDIDSSSPHAEDVLWLAHSDISKGWNIGSGKKEFRPYDSVARCDMAAFLRRFAASSGKTDAATWTPSEADWNKFSDVTKETDHAEDILWLAHTKITFGFKDDSFKPYANITRCDMAAFLNRIYNKIQYDADIQENINNVLVNPASDMPITNFTDVDPTTDHYFDIQCIAAMNITTGYPDGSFRPYESVVRCDMAAFLHRTFNEFY